ncbi:MULTISPECIES: hypothetical protein [unclassified Microcoleus]|uniref:hypothetical protein n=1 Tax=unclassified Microcoleus TaxID=2642155 RepID=UPI002FD1DE94
MNNASKELREIVAVHPDTTLVELCELFAQKTGNLVVEQPCVTPYKSWDYNPQKK